MKAYYILKRILLKLSSRSFIAWWPWNTKKLKLFTYLYFWNPLNGGYRLNENRTNRYSARSCLISQNFRNFSSSPKSIFFNARFARLTRIFKEWSVQAWETVFSSYVGLWDRFQHFVGIKICRTQFYFKIRIKTII